MTMAPLHVPAANSACISPLSSWRLTWLSALLAAVLALPAVAAEQVEKQLEFDIPSQAVETALLEFSRQADVQVMVGSSSLTGLRTPGLKGRFSVSGALRQLLENTGLAFETTGTTVTVRSIATATTGAAVQPLVNAETLASTISPAPTTLAAEQGKAPSTSTTRVETLQEVVVIGSHIRGERSAGSSVHILDRDDIDESSYATVQDVLNTVPQNIGGAPSEDFNPTTGNFNKGSGVNLRGLGADATLILVNGRRQAASGTESGFVDVSGIPASAIDRIEILTDGASAIYGSDAVGGVVNIVLRGDYEGAETRVRLGSARGGAEETQVAQLYGTAWDSGNLLAAYQFSDRGSLERSERSYTASEDHRRLGGSDWRSTNSNPGNIYDPFTFLPSYAIPPGQDGRTLDVTSLLPGTVNLTDSYEGGELLPSTQTHSAFVAWRQQVDDRLELHADARFSQREHEQVMFAYPSFLFVPESNPFYIDPYGLGSVLVSYSMEDDLGLITSHGDTRTISGGIGAAWRFSGSWSARLTGSFARESMDYVAENLANFDALNAALADPNPETAFNPFGDGSNTSAETLNRIRETQIERSVSRVRGATLLADGELFRLGGRKSKLALGLDYRMEDLASGATNFSELSRDVSAAFAEWSLPIFGQNGSSRLDLSLAARYEDYSDFGSTTNPRVGISWQPIESFALRATWGTSFKAPRLVDIDESPQSSATNLSLISDPQSVTGDSFVLLMTGKNADLQEETADIWTAGFDLHLSEQVAPTVSLTYFDIAYEDRILFGGPPGNAPAILFQEEQWAEIIRRNPSAAEIERLCSAPQFQGIASDCTVTPPVAIIDLRLRNLGVVDVQGIDVNVAHQILTPIGEVGLSLNGSYLFHYERAASESSPVFDVADTVGNPTALRLRGGLSWKYQGWGGNVFVNYVGDYKDNVSMPNRRIGSWTTLDTRLAYSTSNSSGWLSNVSFALSATNLFDTEPPFYNFVEGYDIANADLIGRVISAQVVKTW